MMQRSKKQDSGIIEKLKPLKQFGFQKLGDFNPEDVFLVGYPKSGNTLLQHVLAHLVYGLRSDTSKSLINSCVTEYYNNPYFFRHNQRHFFKSHELPNHEFRNVIYVVRDGRAAVLSYYHMQRNMGKPVSLEQFFRSGGESFAGTWANHITTWSENKYDANILFVRYEDLINNKAEEVERICAFLDLDRTSEEIQNVIDATSFDNMKNMEKGFSWQRSKSFKTWDEKGSFVREGKAASFRNDDEIDPEWLNAFEEISREMLYNFKYLD